jgi:D-beta-D-heptose 7-phosphate kinase/D-beta-D-heptose 1-phosphate adenosyltransferase
MLKFIYIVYNESFEDIMIIVIGDYITDKYTYGEVNRISPESPIPIFNEIYTEYRAGGAGNVDANLKSLGSDTVLYSDLVNPSIKTRYVCDNHIMFRSDDDNISSFNGPYSFDLSDTKYCIISDYGKGFVNNSQEIIDYCLSFGCIVIVDPKKSLKHYRNSSIIKLNKLEFEKYSEYDNYQEALDNYNIAALVITCGKDGVILVSKEGEIKIPAIHHAVSDVTGAGDVFVAAMTHFLNKEMSLYDACVKATRLASISVTKFGTYVLTEEDIKQTKTVFTNGCFDIIHRGHVDYLKKSRALGSKLIVGLNSDLSVKSNKGVFKPVNAQEDRKAILESLDCVDEVIIFDEPTPFELIKSIRPDIITKGGDYKMNDVIGKELAEVVIIPFLDGYSTTKILERASGK